MTEKEKRPRRVTPGPRAHSRNYIGERVVLRVQSAERAHFARAEPVAHGGATGTRPRTR
ncbi:hypothetical protein FTUN_2833 [Frigoriglobus tundricola]|uniref:Uncharacterized protein n=1 Tax=Frigoriglobus tundricola TaxID=2774151 RepID=A0A6M5YPW5_9BACT|nr:hypothetical protein FTUN_2833 [Frigoriglobus tundricola]